MNAMRWMGLWVISFVLALAGTASAQLTQDELKERFRTRHEQIVQQKEAGTIGETALGFLESRQGDGSAQALVQAENADRAQLYALLATEQQTSADEVGRQSAIFKFKKAGPNEYFKGKDGVWRKKADMLKGPGA